MKTKTPVSPEAARLKMADLCARSEQCEADIKSKLYKMGMTSAQTAEIIGYLTDHKFIDNARFAGSFARDKCRFSDWGRYKIQVALAAKRISAQDIAEGISSIDPHDYEDALRRTATAKARTLNLFGDDAREARMKLFRHILSRGFESGLAAEAVRSIIREAKE